ncbi:ribosome biogenesis regulatory protein-domain-containing protein [Lactarius indigo]|nr:ribosome biogenesis regulatory protein-domain-containing protein [Lactarius indigo]
MSRRTSRRGDPEQGELLPLNDLEEEARYKTPETRLEHDPGGRGMNNSTVGGHKDFDDGANPLWSLYSKEAQAHDEALFQGLLAEMNGVPTFAGLFAAVLTSFLVDSLQNLQPDPAQQSVYYHRQSVEMLAQISQQIASIAPQVSISSTPPPPYPAFRPSSADLQANGLWLVGLVFSLSAALLATFIQRWVRSYMEALQEYDHEACLQSIARDGIQLLLAALFSPPTLPSPEGPLAQLPPPTTQLSRAELLHKPKTPNKVATLRAREGHQPAAARQEIWDDERQAWVLRWGWKGKNKDEETPWLHEVPANADADDDPSKEARVARKESMAKNERQHLQNVARAQQGPTTTTTGTQVDRKRYIDRTLATTRTSTASMGKFHRALDGEKKLRGVRHKIPYPSCLSLARAHYFTPNYICMAPLRPQFDPIEKSVDAEKNANMALIKQIGNGASGSSSKKSKRDGGGGAGDVVNVRKAVSFASGGQGAAALVRKSGSGS